jgi:hypothetical protein
LTPQEKTQRDFSVFRKYTFSEVQNMKWCDLFSGTSQPTLQDVRQHIGNTLFDELCQFVEESYSASLKLEYSRCSAAPGWNVKYKKSGKSICTIYPHEGFFTCLVIVSEKDAMEAELMIGDCDPAVQKLYGTSVPMNGSRWLMIDVTNQKILEDVENLVRIRTKKQKAG